MTYKRKKYHHGDTHLKKRWRVRNRKKDLDQIDEDIKDENAEKLLNQAVDLDVPGAAQHYCLHCARYFIDNHALLEHFKTKVHKRRLKALELEPYSIEESERAAGHGNFKLPNKRKITTQNTEDTDITEEAEEESPNKKKKLLKRYSALFMNGPKATDNFVFVTPYIDFHQRIKHKDTIKSELNKRQVNYDLDKLENLWSVYESVKNKKYELDIKKISLSKQLEDLLENNKEDHHVEKLKIQINLLKENIKKLKIPLWSAEEAAIVEFLKLPNNLHHLTPDENSEIIHKFGSLPSGSKDHLIVGKAQNLICFTKNENYYLQGDAAIFELGAKFYFSQMLKQNKFIQFSNPDFVKSLIIEGCGTDHTDSDSTFILHHNDDAKPSKDSRLHLTGASSVYSFLAYHTKNVLHNKVFPLKYFALGRQYVPSPVEEDSLFHVSQSSAAQIFVIAKNNSELDNILCEIINMTKTIYNSLGYHYRLSYIPANRLNTWESLRLAIEMYSSSLKSYVEVGNISLSGDYMCKRLMLTYTEEKQSQFPHILSGTILNVPKLLACILEQDNNFVLPEPFKVTNWSI